MDIGQRRTTAAASTRTRRATLARAVAAMALAVCSAMGVGLPLSWSSAAAAAPGGPAPGGPAPASAGVAGTQPAFSSLAACMAARHVLLVDLLMDTSDALRATDPDADRVAAARTALISLYGSLLNTGAANPPVIDVAIDGYADRFVPVTPWEELDSGSLPGLSKAIDTFARDDNGVDSDYVVGLQGAQQVLTDRAAELTANGAALPCEAVLWFSGSPYSLAVRTAADASRFGTTKPYAPGVSLTSAAGVTEAQEDGQRTLCAPGGVADQLHQSSALIFAVALNAQNDAAEQDLMDGVATGGQLSCGTAGSVNTGAFYSAAQFVDLPFFFDEVTERIGGGSPAFSHLPTPVCPSNPCGVGRWAFSIEPYITRFHLLVDTGGANNEVVLLDPAGAAATVTPGSGSAAIGASRVQWTEIGGTFQLIDISLPATGPGWIGPWSISVVAPGVAVTASQWRAQLTLFGDLSAQLVGAHRLVAGQPAVLVLALHSSTGIQNLPPSSGITITASEFDPVSNVRTTLPLGPEPGNRYRVSVPASFSGTTTIDMTVHIVVGNSQQAVVTTSTQSFPLTVDVSPEFPRLTPSTLHLTPVSGLESADGEVDVRTVLGGCVAFDGQVSQYAPPAAAGLTAALSPAVPRTPACHDLPSHTVTAFRVLITPHHQAAGTATGYVTFVLRSSGGQVVRRSVPYSFVMSIPPNVGRAVAVFVLLLLLGLLIPFVLLGAINWAGAQFEPPQKLKYARRRVSINLPGGHGGDPEGEPDSDGARRPASLDWGDTGPPGLSDFDFLDKTGAARRTRRVLLPGTDLNAVTAAMGRRGEHPLPLIRGPYAAVEGGSTVPVVHGEGLDLKYFPRTGRHQVPLSLANTWIFVADERDGADPERPPATVTGSLLLLAPVDAGARGNDGSVVVGDAVEHLARLVTEGVDRPVRSSPRSARRRHGKPGHQPGHQPGGPPGATDAPGGGAEDWPE